MSAIQGKKNRITLILLAILLSPFIIDLSAQEYWQPSNGPYGGPIDCVVFNSRDEAFAFTHWGGLFYSNNHGDSWERRGDIAATRAVFDTNDVLITNELYTPSINRSTDGGLTWTRFSNVINATRVYALAVNSLNTLFAGTSDNGMFRSDNGGADWTEINTNLTHKQVNAITTYGARIYIGTTGGKVFRSNDNGNNWEPASTGITETDVYSILYITGGILLAGTSNGIYRSLNNGDTWQMMITGLPYVTSLIKYNDNIIYASTYDGVYVSTDGGLTWNRVINGMGSTNVTSIAVCIHNIILAGTYFGFNNGMYRSMDNGANWTQVNNGLRGVRIWKMAVAPNGNIYAGSYSSGMFRSIDGGNLWQPINNGLMGFNQSYMIKGVAVNLVGWVFIATYGAGAFRSTDNGNNWTQINSGLPSTYIMSLAYFPYPGEVYVGTANNGVYKSPDNGDNWAHTGAQLDTISVENFKMAPNNTIFAGTYYKGIFRSTNFGGQWTQVGSGDLGTADVFSVAVNSKGDIFAATYGKGIFRSTNNGNTWVQLTQGLQDNTYFRPLAVNRLDHVFAASMQVFVSKNDGDNWNNITSNIADNEINTFALNLDGLLFAGTNHGVYRSIISTTQVSINFLVKMLYAEGFNPATDTVVVRGNFNYWGAGGDHIIFNPVNADPDLTYIGSFVTNSPDTLTGWIPGDSLQYKFLFKKAGGVTWENDIDNRIFIWDHLSDLDLPAVWFNSPANNPDDSAALTALYNSSGGSNWTNKDNWLTDRPFAHWYGVTADITGRVIMLNLENNNLKGTIPMQISLLQKMRQLNLSLNQISSSIPHEIGQLQNLGTLYLRNNALSGNIPGEIGNITKLVDLDLGQNTLSGALPTTLGNLGNLEQLHVGSNQLNGIIPTEIGNLTNLKVLELYDNQFTGAIPTAISSLANLEYLRLYNNQLSDRIPTGLGYIKKLREISLQQNQFYGAVPATLTGIDSLRMLFLQSNKFFDLPNLKPLSRLTNLEVQNNQLTFEDLEPNVGIAGFIYSPQDSVGTAYDTTVAAGSSLSMNVSVNGAYNQYQWYHNGTSISGATDSSYTIDTVNAKSPGKYICNITNTVVTNLTLYSRPITVIVPGVVPAVPLLNAPINGATNIPVNPTLIWNSATGAQTYQLQVCKNNSFTPPLVFDQSGLTATSQQVTGLNGNTTYYWQVRASNSTGPSDWSAVWSFTTAIGGTPPNPPVLVAPANNSSNVSIFPTLQWTAAAGSYQIQIDNDSDLSSPFVDIDTLTLQKFTIRDRGLQFDSTYYWHVAVNVGGTQSEWSGVWNFTTESYPSDIPLQNTTDFPTKSSPGDFVSTDYKIYGIPGNDSAPLGDLLGGKPGTNWQAYWDNGKISDFMAKFDGSGTFTCITGRAFWLVSNGAVTVYMTATNAPLNSDQQTEIDVHSGWNLITDPFLFTVNWDDVRQINGITVPLWRFTGESGSLWLQENRLQPYVGYYFDNATSLSKLKVPYKPVLAKPVIRDKKQWQISLGIESQGLQENIVQLGVAGDALAGWDRYDYRKPRAVGPLPGVYFDRPQWDGSYGIFATDFRPPSDNLERWTFTVTATAGQRVILTVGGVEDIPAGQGVCLLDKEQLCALDLLQQDRYSFIAARTENDFEIIVGRQEDVKNELSTIVPRKLELGKNFPNPFNPTTTIPVTLPQDMRIVLKVYNLLGQEIETLYDGMLNTGRHYFFWNGDDRAGQKMPSGIYLYRLTTDQGGNLTGKMVLIK
jgi:photosystem II stability/assembly factor-like uncharacterized protein/Leucine-rich repeat (LRR) protein